MSGKSDTLYGANTKTSEDLREDPLLIDLPRSSTGDISIGCVVLLSKLGEGGMGRVYLGWHQRLGINVAVKILKPASSGDVPLFRREGHLTAQVDHPNLIKIFDIDVEPVSQLNFMVIEYIKGSSAYQILETQLARSGRPLSEIAAVTICLNAAKALGAVHNAGVVHCDVKADNILIRNLDGTVKLTDLGLAARESEFVPNPGNQSSVAGTIGFVSPEILRGAAPTPRSDIYSLGATLYELITGELPHGAPFDQSYTVRQLTEQPIALDSLFGGFNPKVVSIINRCLEQDPEKRFENGDKLADSLQEALLHLSGSASELRCVKSAASPENERPKILCVDDDSYVLDVVKSTLEYAGFDPICFTDPRQALLEIKNIKPHVAVLDLQMPVMNGLQLAQALRDVDGYSDLAVLILSGECSSNTISNALERRITDYLMKPLNSSELIVRLKLLSKLRAMNQERGEIETHLQRLKTSVFHRQPSNQKTEVETIKESSSCLCQA